MQPSSATSHGAIVPKRTRQASSIVKVSVSLICVGFMYRQFSGPEDIRKDLQSIKAS